MSTLSPPWRDNGGSRRGVPPSFRAMLEPRRLAVVGASDRAGSFGRRMTLEALRSPAKPHVDLVNPRRATVLGQECLPGLESVDEPPDLVLLGVPDAALVEQLQRAASIGAAGAVIFGSAVGLGPRLREIATDAGMALCGAACMGFVNVSYGIRALGYIERFPLEPGPVALVSHSGSAFSALLRTHRRLAFSLAVSSGLELVSTAADYLHYALQLPETQVIGLLLETLRDADRLASALDTAAGRNVPVVALTVGSSPTGRAMVDAHSGAVAGDDAAWEALFDAYGVHRVDDMDEMVDTLEVFAIGRRPRPGAVGLATVHDSGAERALVADTAAAVGIHFASLQPSTLSKLSEMLDPGLRPDNPLDVWGTGADTRALFADCLRCMAGDPAVGAVALVVDLVAEYDDDESYVDAVLDAADTVDSPLVVLSNVASAVDQSRAARLRASDVPVLEGTRSGLRALRCLLTHGRARVRPAAGPVDAGRAAKWRNRLAAGPVGGAEAMCLLADYGLPAAVTIPAVSAPSAVAAAEQLGYPVVLKSDEPALTHKTDVGGVILGLTGTADVERAYLRLTERLGHRVVVQAQAGAGVELALGLVRDPALGPLIVLAAGGTLVEVLSQRVVALPPLDAPGAARMLERLPASRLLDGVRGGAASDAGAVHAALVGLSQLAIELGESVDALDVNPLVVSPAGALAVDALVVPHRA
jgi:acetate---CoA ligase (ADP-forming)